MRALLPTLICLASLSFANEASASPGDVGHGKAFFQQSCAICHADSLGQGNEVIVKQGPSLVGVLGRKAGTSAGFNFTDALHNSGLTWDAPTLDRFLTGPATLVPGTTMPISVSDAGDRADLIAYLSTLQMPANTASTPNPAPAPVASSSNDPGDWQNAAPGVKRHITVADLPAPFATRSAGNGPRVVKRPDNAALSVPPGFTVRQFAAGLSDPRLLRVAPNGDIFIAETGARRIRVMRAADGADAPSENQIFAEGLDRPFGLAFYPPGSNPKWLYVANNNSVVRIPYQNGDLKATGVPEVIVPQLEESHGGHSTRDVAFSPGRQAHVHLGRVRVKRRRGHRQEKSR